jgi:hypothetical protein
VTNESQASRSGILTLVLGMGALLLVSLHVARCQAFFGLAFYDDEGYFLLSLRQYSHGAVLYDQLYSQYGPAYFEILHQTSRLLNFDLTHTASRLFTLVAWLASSVLCGVATYRLTRSSVMALCSQAIVLEVLAPLLSEPLHPAGLLCLILSATVLTGTFIGTKHGTAAAATLGALIGAAALTKVNIGGLALISALYALATAAGRHARPFALAAGAAMVSVAPALMAAGWAHAWVRTFAALVAGSAGAVVLTGLGTAGGRTGEPRHLMVMLTSFLVASALFCAAPLAHGTSLSGLFHGVVLDPARFPNVFMIATALPPNAPVWAVFSAVVSLVLAGGRPEWTRKPAATVLLASAQLFAGAMIWLAHSLEGFAVALPLLWIPLATFGPGDRRRQDGAGDLLLVSLAVLQVLHAYPVAGDSHKASGTFLFVPVGAIGMVRGWNALFAPQPSGRALIWRWLPLSLLAAALLAPTIQAGLDQWRFCTLVANTTVPLGLPGAETVRVPPAQADTFQQLTRELRTRCRTFITMPGLNSLYLFTGMEPPTTMNVGAWMNLFSPVQQEQIRARFSKSPPPLCAVRNKTLVAYWMTRRPAAGEWDLPLARYIDDEFVTVNKYHLGSEYEFMIQRGEPFR